MRKIFYVSVAGFCLVTFAAMAQMAIGSGGARSGGRSVQCSYTPLQEIIRDARSAKEILQLTQKKVDFNTAVRCGGSPLQLAVLRGNPEVVKAIIEGGADVNADVSLEDFDIPGAPNEVPFPLFAAYYAPRQDIMLLILSAGVDMTIQDANGESMLWYINQNPVLRNTAVSDKIRGALLYQTHDSKKEEEAVQVSTASKTQMKVQPKMRQVIDPRTPQKGGKTQMIPKTSSVKAEKASVSGTSQEQPGILSEGMTVQSPQAAYPTREIVEPSIPIK